MLRRIYFLIIVCGLSVIHGQPYRGAELRTHEYFQYGRFETRLKSPQGEGFLASFFTYNDSFPATDWCEIDFEILGRWSDNVDVNIIDENGSHLRQHPLSFNPHIGFHTYAMEWTPEYVAWFVDGEEFYRQSGGHITHLSEPTKLMMNIWTPAYEDWVGFIDERTLPRFAYYDWASYAAYTPGSGSVGTDSDFTLVWVDDFETYNDTIWEKSDNHGWNGNNSLLVEENIVYQDGMMILCLTLPGEEGYGDDTAPKMLWARAINPDSVVVRFSEELDPEIASLSTTYTIPNYPILSTILHEDQRTVSLTLEDLDINGSATVYAQGLKDQSPAGNTQAVTFVPITLPAPLELPIRINCAGDSAQGFLKDQWWSHDVEYGHEGGNYQTAHDYPEFDGTELDTVMATSLNRYSRYHIRLKPGTFDIQLHFAEQGYHAVGERVFELFVEDSLIEAELDVFDHVGNSGVYTITLSGWDITDGSLDILGAALIYGAGYAYAGPLLNAIEIDGSYWVGVRATQNPLDYELSGIFPNPFNPSTQIEFTVPEMAHVNVSLFNLRGAQVMKLANRPFNPGKHRLTLHGAELSSGVYFVRLTSGNYHKSHKILLLK